ncbi:MAG TPA: ATP-binding cassette domain-containing protein [Nitrospirota bacterium]|jgi:tungstate transport system ATP-binding protein
MSIGARLSGVSKRFGAREALAGISCEMPPGVFSVIIGPNGSGKTTLMRLMARLDAPTAGAVEHYDGSGVITPGLGLMRRMTLIPQRAVMFTTTVEKNVAYGLKARGIKGGELEARVSEALALTGLEGLAHEQAKKISGGEAQRAAIARAYAIRPELLLLDEPTANLDPEGGKLMERVIAKMREEFGTTIVMVTHNLFLARRIGELAFVMDSGRVVEHGLAAEVFGRPRQEFTRRFVSGDIIY